MRSRLRRSVYGGPAAAPARARPTHRRHSRRRAIVRTRPIVGMPNRPGRYAVLGRGCVATIRHVATQHNMLQHSTTCCERSCRLLFAVDCTGCARLNRCTASSSCRAQWAELTTTGRSVCMPCQRQDRRCTLNVAGLHSTSCGFAWSIGMPHETASDASDCGATVTTVTARFFSPKTERRPRSMPVGPI
jgi:hypothetical protein